MSPRVRLLFSYFFTKRVLTNQNKLISAPLNAQSIANWSAPNSPQASNSLTVLSLSEYIKAHTVITAAIIQNTCQRI